MRTFFTMLIGLTVYTVSGQDLNVIASQGGYTEFDNGSVSWTLGETFTNTLSEGETIITQGFQQTNLSYTSLKTNSDLFIEMSVYPNPTPNVIYLKTNDSENLSYQLINISGKVVAFNEVHSNIEKIDMAELPCSTYILRVMQKQNLLKTFQIIKQ